MKTVSKAGNTHCGNKACKKEQYGNGFKGNFTTQNYTCA